MKKRLLSAALALAMVLTLLPLSAFAAAATSPAITLTEDIKSANSSLASVTWRESGYEYTSSNGTKVQTAAAGYYSFDSTGNGTLYQAVSGVLGNTTSATSGTWYASPVTANGSIMSSFTLIDACTISSGALIPASVSVNVNNKELNLSSGAATSGTTKFSSLTVTNTPATGTADKTAGEVTLGSIWDNLTDRSINLSVTNATVTGSIGVSQATGANTSYGITATTVNNAALPSLTVTDGPMSLRLTNQSEVGNVKVTSGKPTTASITLEDSSATQGIAVSVPSGGTINVGSSGTRGTVKGELSLTNTSSTASGGTITAYNANLGGVVLNGIGTKLSATNCTISGTVAVTGNGFPGGPTLDQATKDRAALPTVEIHGGNVSDGTNNAAAIRTGYQSEQLTGAYNITIDGNAKVGSISLGNAKINVTSSQTGDITLPAGSLTVNGTGSGSGNQYAQLGNLTLGGSNTQVDFKVTGQRVSVGKITLVNSGTGVVNAFIPAEDSNVFGEISGKFSNRGIEGGTFTRTNNGRPHGDNLSTDLRYIAEGNGDYVSYYKGTDLQKVVDFWQKYAGSTGGDAWIYPVGQTSANGRTVAVFDGDDLLTVITYYNTPTNIYLPDTLNGKKVTKYTQSVYTGTTANDWVTAANPANIVRGQDATAGVNYSTPIRADGSPTPHADVKLNLQESDNSITKLTNVRSTMDGVTARLGSGNVITLSGSLLASGTSNIVLKITTDGKPGLVEQPITVVYDPSATPVLKFGNMTEIGNGLHLSSNRDRLYMPDDSTYYTLNGSGLKVQASKLPSSQIIGYTEDVDVQVKVTKSGSGWTPVRQQDVGKALTTAAENNKNSYANFKDSLAVKEALNAVVATITDSQIDGWVRQAQDAAWRAAKKTGTMTDGQRATSGYHKVYVEAFLDVTMSDFNSASTPGTFTATMVPSYRIYVKDESGNLVVPEGTSNFRDVVDANGTRNDYLVRTQSLGSLTGDAGKIVVNLDVTEYNKLPSEGTSRFTVTNAQAHQSGTYVYDAGKAINAVKFTITHTVSNGLGTIVVNGEQPTVHLTNYKLDANGNATNDTDITATYDTLQAAVDDVTNGGVITVAPEYKGSVAITVDGQARKFTINSNGNRTITSSSPNVVVDGTAGGNRYTVQLTRDNIAVKPTQKPIPVNAVAVTGGSASLSASRADEGDTITVTLTPAANYRVGGVTVTAAVKNSNTGVTTNTTVITTAVSANSWRFVVPTGATSVTVTPSFVAATTTNPTVTVSNPAIGGTAATTAGNNQVAPGTPVTVTVSPTSGYRTMGIYVTNATASRTGANTFSFTVPANTTNVVVTPRFDRTNGTLFEDVWSYDYFSSAVAWAVGRGITNGDGSVYRFGTGKSCTREDMVTFLWRNAGSPVVTGVTNPFWDVQVGSYYYNAVMWAIKNGITKGVSSNQFGVGRPVTRGEAVTFLYRAAGEPAASTNSGFYDVPSSQYYAKAVTWAVGKGITNGDGSAVRFNPNGSCLREQIVTFMYRNATGTRA